MRTAWRRAWYLVRAVGGSGFYYYPGSAGPCALEAGGMKYQSARLHRGKPGSWSNGPVVSPRQSTFSELSFYSQGSFAAWHPHPEGAQPGVSLAFHFWMNLSPSAAPSTWACQGSFPRLHSPPHSKAWPSGCPYLGLCLKISKLLWPGEIFKHCRSVWGFFIFKVYLFSNL